ncbi:MAG: hypothetical protein ABWX56_04215 [Mycetocola sp.]
MDTDTGATPDDSPDQTSETTDVPMTAAGERSPSVDADDAGILPTAEPTEGGAPAP